MRVWLLIGLVGLVLIQPIQQGQAAQATKSRQQGEKQESPPQAQPSQPREPIVKPSASHESGNENQPLSENKHSYWKEAFGPPTWSNWFLAFIGFIGIVAAYFTLRIIERQTKATEDAATATQKSVELQKVAMDQWIDIRELSVQAYVPQGVNKSPFPISFKLGNPTKFPLILKTLTIWIDRKHVQSVGYRYLLLPPDKDISVVVEWHIEGVNLSNYRANCLMFELGGLISFTDTFKETREQKFGFICKCGPTNGGQFTLSAFTTPDEEKQIKEQENWRETPN